MKLRRLIAAMLAGAVIVGCGVLPVGPLSAHGSVVLSGGPWEVGAPCSGSGDAVGVRDGGSIVVAATDVEGSVAEGTLGPGVAEASTSCRLPFAIDGIPRGFEQYSLIVPGSNGLIGATYHLSEEDVATRSIEVAVPSQ